MNQGQGPIFIVGMPRSGTTLMSAILNRHPRIAIPPAESHFLDIWRKKHRQILRRDAPRFENFWAEYQKNPRFVQTGLEPEAVRKRIDSSGDATYRGIFASMLDEYGSREGKPRYGDKTPAHFFHLKKLLDWFPSGRIVFMMRDPRAVLASLLGVPWAPEWVDHHAHRWVESARTARRWQGDERVQVIRYEDVVASTEPTVRSVCQFLGEDYIPEMIRETRDDAEVAKRLAHHEGWRREHQRQALGPVQADRVDRWRMELTPTQISIVEHIAREEMMVYGYDPESRGLRRGELARLRVDQAVRWGVQMKRRISRRLNMMLGISRS